MIGESELPLTLLTEVYMRISVHTEVEAVPYDE